MSEIAKCITKESQDKNILEFENLTKDCEKKLVESEIVLDKYCKYDARLNCIKAGFYQENMIKKYTYFIFFIMFLINLYFILIIVT